MRVGNALERIGAWVLLVAMPCGAYALANAALWQWRNWPEVWDVDDALALAAAALGAAVASYLTVSALVMVAAAALRQGRAIPVRARAIAPVAWQKVTAVALGIGLSSGVAVPAMASSQIPPGLGWADAPATAEHTAEEPNPVDIRLDWGVAAVSEEEPLPEPEAEPVEPQSTAAGAYVVQPGDSLWGIASGLLGDDATPAQIQAAWPLLYEANRAEIGDNPSLIFTGTELHIPAELAR
jgi:nucleoid-associated protein YgaU